MKHLFLPYELAVIAKEKGFNEPCVAFYKYPNQLEFFSDSDRKYKQTALNNRIDLSEGASAPLYQQIIDWFREEKKIHICVNYSFHGGYFGSISRPDKSVMINTELFSDYYEALNKSLEEAFKLI